MMWHKSKDDSKKQVEKNKVEIVAQKNATSKVISDAKKSNAILRKVLDENHFTVNIAIVMGAKTRKARDGN